MPGRSHLAEEDLPVDQVEFVAINARLANEWPLITAARDPLPDADWAIVKDKKHYLFESA